MSNDSCESVREMLVDYDDGQLKAEQAAEVAEHLSVCPLCRQELDALQDSLKLTKEIWENVAANVEDVQIALPLRKRRVALKRLAAVAAGVVLATSALIWIWSARTTDSRGPMETGEITSASEAARFIEREGASAKLAATAQILANVPGGQEAASGTFRYLAHTYPETVMGKEALAKIGSN